RDTRRIVQIEDAERDARLAAVVARIAHRLDELSDVRLRAVVLDRRLVGREVDAGRGDAHRPRQRLLDRRGAARAGHAFDGKYDPGFTHACRRGTCGVMRPRAARPPAPPRAVL